MFYQIFVSPQVKRRVIISNKQYKHGLYELPNDLKLRILEKIRKISKLAGIVDLCPVFQPKWKVFLILAKNSWKIEIELFP